MFLGSLFVCLHFHKKGYPPICKASSKHFTESECIRAKSLAQLLATKKNGGKNKPELHISGLIFGFRQKNSRKKKSKLKEKTQ